MRDDEERERGGANAGQARGGCAALKTHCMTNVLDAVIPTAQ